MVPIEATWSGRKIVADQKVLATGRENTWLYPNANSSDRHRTVVMGGVARCAS